MSHHPPPQSLGEHQPVPPDNRQSRQRLVEFLWSSRRACIPMAQSEARMQQNLQPGGSALYHQENDLLPQSQEYFSSDEDATLASIAQNRSNPTWASQARAAELKALQGHQEIDDGFFVPLNQDLIEMAPGKRRQQWKPLDLHQLSEATNSSADGGNGSSRPAVGGSENVNKEQDGYDADTTSSHPHPSHTSGDARSRSHLSDVSAGSYSHARSMQYAQLTSSRKSEGSESLQGFENPAVAQLPVDSGDFADPALLSGQRFGHNQRQAAKPPSHYPAVKGTTGDKRYNQYRAAASGRSQSDLTCSVEQLSRDGKMTQSKGSPSASTPMNPEASIFRFGGASKRTSSSGTYASVAAASDSTAGPAPRDKLHAAGDGVAQSTAARNPSGTDLEAQSGPAKPTLTVLTGGNTHETTAGMVTSTMPRQNSAHETTLGKSYLPTSSTHHGLPQGVYTSRPDQTSQSTQPVKSAPARIARADNLPNTRPVLGHSFGPVTKRALDVVRGYSLEPNEEPVKGQTQEPAHGYGQGQGRVVPGVYASDHNHERPGIPDQGYSYGSTYGAAQVPSQQGPTTRPALGRSRVQPVVSNLPNRLQPATLYGRRKGAFHTRDDDPPNFSANGRTGFMRAPPGLLSEDINLPTIDNRHDQMWFYRDNRFSAETAAEITTLWNQAKQKTAAEKEREQASQTKNVNSDVTSKCRGVGGDSRMASSHATGGTASADGKAETKAGDKPCSSQGKEPTTQEAEERENALDVVEDLIMPVLANLREYMVGPRDYFTQNWTQPPEWCIDRSAAGLQSAFGDTWGTPPARVGRDPRYRSVQSDGRTPPTFNPSASSTSAPSSGITPVGPRQQQLPTQPAQYQYRPQPHRQQHYRPYQQHSAGRAWRSEESPSRRN